MEMSMLLTVQTGSEAGTGHDVVATGGREADIAGRGGGFQQVLAALIGRTAETAGGAETAGMEMDGPGNVGAGRSDPETAAGGAIAGDGLAWAGSLLAVLGMTLSPNPKPLVGGDAAAAPPPMAGKVAIAVPPGLTGVGAVVADVAAGVARAQAGVGGERRQDASNEQGAALAQQKAALPVAFQAAPVVKEDKGSGESPAVPAGPAQGGIAPSTDSAEAGMVIPDVTLREEPTGAVFGRDRAAAKVEPFVSGRDADDAAGPRVAVQAEPAGDMEVGPEPALEPGFHQVGGPGNVVESAAHGDEAHHPLAAEGPVTVRELFDRVVSHARLYRGPEGATIHLQLRPEHMGRVEVHLDWQGQAVAARFMVERPEARQALEANLAQLQQTLRQEGLEVAGLNVALGQGSGLAGRQEGGRDPRGAPRIRAAADVTAAAAVATVGADQGRGWRTGDGRLDYLV